MRKFSTSKKNIIIPIVIIVVGIVSIIAIYQPKNSEGNTVQAVVNDTIASVNKVITAPKRWLNNRTKSVSNLTSTYKENQKLKNKVHQTDDLKQQAKNQAQEIERLKAEAELNQTLTNYEKVSATVITRSPKTWQDTLIVDKGSDDGVQKNMAVMSQKGLIGRVMDVDAHSAKIRLLTSNNKSSNHFSIKISSKNGDSLGVLNKYDEEAEQLIGSQFSREKDIKEGDVVKTSGLGGNSPADLVIGKVVKVKTDSYGMDQEAHIKPYAQMDDISFVTIIQGMVE